MCLSALVSALGSHEMRRHKLPIITKKNETPVFGRPKFHMWCGVSAQAPRHCALKSLFICFLNKQLAKEMFAHILQGFLLPTTQVLHENDWWLQQNGDRKHTAGHVKQVASGQKRAVLE